MTLTSIIVSLLFFAVIDALVIRNGDDKFEQLSSESKTNEMKSDNEIGNVFDGVYTECFLRLSYTCVQKKTLLYLRELNQLAEVSVVGDYVKFVKLNESKYEEDFSENDKLNAEELSFQIDKAVDKFFKNHVMKFSAMGKDIAVPNTGYANAERKICPSTCIFSNMLDEFVGRKRRKGGGGGGGHGGGDDGGKKKMMMMAMMCMKMKLMMMVPAMMGMMGMMSFKGMMFSMMSFMMAKLMLLMKILEKKGGGGGGGGGGDGGWAAGGGGGGAWMPAGPDYGGGGSGGGGGYDANGQWQSRSIMEESKMDDIHNKPIVSYVTPFIRFNDIDKIPYPDKLKDTGAKNKAKSRRKRGIIDALQNVYTYWINRILGNNINRRKLKQPNYKIVNGIKYVYYPMKALQKIKTPKEIQSNTIKNMEEFKPIVIAEDFNKGEIIEGPIESRMNRKKFNKMKNAVNDTVEDNPWE